MLKMTLNFKFLCIFLLVQLFNPLFALSKEEGVNVSSADAGQSVLIPFNSELGLARFINASAKVDFPALANQFEAQSNRAFCGPTTAAIILNTVYGRNQSLPRDTSRIKPEDSKNLNPGFDLTVPRFTQETVILKGRKTRAQVLGEPVLINGNLVRDGGYQLREFDEMLRANQLKTSLRIISDQTSINDIRQEFIKNLKMSGDYLVVNYRREDVGQKGGAHISPVGAYDEASDSILIMDVNPAAQGWVWMPLSVIFKGMNTFDKIENRGYVLIEGL